MKFMAIPMTRGPSADAMQIGSCRLKRNEERRQIRR